MPTQEGLSQRDREEMRDAILRRYKDADITAVQARGELANVGYNATQISELITETLKQVLHNVRTKGLRHHAD